jgi:hypothetical protein
MRTDRTAASRCAGIERPPRRQRIGRSRVSSPGSVGLPARSFLPLAPIGFGLTTTTACRMQEDE